MEGVCVGKLDSDQLVGALKDWLNAQDDKSVLVRFLGPNNALEGWENAQKKTSECVRLLEALVALGERGSLPGAS